VGVSQHGEKSGVGFLLFRVVVCPFLFLSFRVLGSSVAFFCLLHSTSLCCHAVGSGYVSHPAFFAFLCHCSVFMVGVVRCTVPAREEQDV